MSDKPFSKGAAGFSGKDFGNDPGGGFTEEQLAEFEKQDAAEQAQDTEWINPQQTRERVFLRLDDMPPGFALYRLDREWVAGILGSEYSMEHHRRPFLHACHAPNAAEAVEQLREKLKCG